MTTDLMPFQEEGATVLTQHDKYGLHDEMGLGKTAQIIRAVDMIDAKRGIVCVPAHLRENWMGEFRKFGLDQNRRLCKGKNIHDFIAWLRGRYHVLITSYELMTKWSEMLFESGEVIDFFALDEGHYLKNTDSQRTRAIIGKGADGLHSAVSWSERIWHITGTPMANDPMDIYTFLKVMGVMPLNKNAFMSRYFTYIKTVYGIRTEPIPEMIPELQALIANNSIRRTKLQVGLQLPPIFLTTSLVDGDTDHVRQMLREYPGLEQGIINAVEQGGLSFLDAQHIATLRRLVGEAKAVPYAHMLEDELNSGADKRVVFGVHVVALQIVYQYLRSKGIDCVIIQGGVSEKARIDAIHRFQNDENCKVFIGNIKAAGTGLTLTAACEIDMMESDWTPAGNAQAIMRVHRIGQTRQVRARFITLARSLDELVNRIVAAKTAAIAQIEGEPMTASPLDELRQFV